ncbi:carbonic anhydrase 4-like isoform X2 [Neoarius graeffei]|nr:carbonic anhydrase 4-like isoform X2 [Neoarius graeffei]
MNLPLVSFFIACLLSTVYGDDSSVEYCYYSPDCNATKWPVIVPHFCSGTHQSPINIVTSKVQADDKLKAFTFNGFNDNSTILNIQNTGKTVKINLDDSKMNVSGGGLQHHYSSIQFHFHWGKGSSVGGSEHTVDGKRYPMEMHIVNLRPDAAVSDSKRFAVLGFFIEANNDSGKPKSWKTLTSFLSNITQAGDSFDIMNQLTVESLIQGVNLNKYYRYLGSLTTPSCNETVVWTVFSDPIKISKDLIDIFSNTVHINKLADAFITKNYRPVQPLNGRNVTSQESGSDTHPPSGSEAHSTSTGTSSSASTLHHTMSISPALLYSVLFWCLWSLSSKTSVIMRVCLFSTLV